MISIGVDSNEQNSTRATNLARAAAERPEVFNLLGFGEYVVDVRAEWKGGAANIEFKEPADYVASILGKEKHLAIQLKDMAATGEIGIIQVLGGDQQIERCCYLRVLDSARAKGDRIDQEEAFDRTKAMMKVLTSFSSLAFRMNIPVLKAEPTKLDPLLPYHELLSKVKHMSEEPDLAALLPRWKGDIQAYSMFASIFGIGHETAMALVEHFGSVYNVIIECRENPKLIADCPVNGKRLGAAKAARIIKAVGLEGYA